jgi:GDP-mannose 6-dehydrogenase
MNVSIFGLGYVGSVTGACLASFGHKVVGVDVNPDKVEATNSARSLIVERGLKELICQGVRTGNLRATHDTASAIAQSDVALICVGTPSDANGNLNFEYIDRVCMEIALVLREDTNYKVIGVRSTMLPGTLSTRLIPLLTRESGKQAGKDFGTAINPEFLREGSAIDDFKNPPFTLIGTRDERAGVVLNELYASISAPVFRTDPDTACMVKYACNAFHGLKVVFANEIGQLCKKAGVDGTRVMEIFCQDTSLNISPRYLKPGFAFGGSCLPKDLRALLYLARHADLQLPMLESIMPSNRLHVQRVVDMILKEQQNRVGIIGLTFKPGTDDLRESPIVDLVETLSGKGLKVRIYDKNVSLSRLIGANKAFIEQVLPHISTMMSDSMEEVVQSSDVIVVSHDLHDGGEQLFNLLRPDQLVIDFVKITFSKSLPAAYEGICW